MSKAICSTCGSRPVHAKGECGTCYGWRYTHQGATRPSSLDERLGRPEGASTTEEVVALTGLSYRQLDYAIRAGRCGSFVPASGSGSRRWWSEAQVEALRRVKARIDFGLTPEAAFRSEDPPLPAPLGAVREMAEVQS